VIEINLTLIGYYGAGNFGDTLMLYFLSKEILDLKKEIRINILMKKDANHDNIKHLKELDKNRVNIIKFKSNDKFNNLKIFYNTIKKTDLLVWGGGTCFTDEDGIGGFNFFLIAKLMGCDVGYLGVGLNSLDRKLNRYKVKLLFKISEFISFRDLKSLNEAKKIFSKGNYYLTEDLAYLYFKNENININNSKKKSYLLISWRNLINYFDDIIIEKLIDNLVTGIEKIAVETKINNIEILPLDNMKDYKINKKIFELLKKEKIDENININLNLNKNFFEKIDIIKRADIFISARLHGAFIGELLQIPTLSLNYSSKVKRFTDSIDSEGLVEPYELIHNSDVLYCSLSKILDCENDLNNKLINDKIKKSYRNIDIINEFIKGD
jgi:polysaccharide pyruvyl transferase WcaK-like protein